MARIVQEFQGSLKPPTASTNTHHHEQVPGVQKEFVRDVKSMVSTMQDMDNPFTEDSHDLTVLDTKQIMSEAVSNSLYNVKTIGQQQYDTFVEGRLEQCSVPFTNIIHKNKIPLFGTSSLKTKYRMSHKFDTLKSKCELFSRMYISCQSREGDMVNFSGMKISPSHQPCLIWAN